MAARTIVLVGFEPDWQALYVYGTKRVEGHHVTTQEVGPFIALAAVGSADTTVYSTHVEEDEADEYGEFDIPDTLAEIAEKYPKAYERISA